ncbi:MAG: hypothetical protein Q7K26_01935 [bacterium]|nr:hypothetical protein [bacterium]
MKTVRLLSALALLMLGLSSHVPASAAGNQVTCTPSTTNNYVACDAGYTGQKFTVTTKTCPDGWPNGIITTTSTYDTSHCLRSAPPQNGDRTCELTPGACSPMPASPGCPLNQHWVLTGSTVAHCVNNDPSCGWGTSLVHDGMGNPSCLANTCPSNKVLQGDGISCACPSGTAWNGSSCVALPPPCTPSSVNGGDVACGAGFTGNKHGVTTNSCPGNVLTFAWDTSSCVPIVVPPPCTPSIVNGSNVTCGAGFTGTKFLVTTNACPGNIISSVWNTSSCVPIAPPPACTPSIVNGSNVVCDPGFIGFKHGVTTTSCPGSVVTFVWDTSACTPFVAPPVCANGATNYPTCTPICAPPRQLVNSAWLFGTACVRPFTVDQNGSTVIYRSSTFNVFTYDSTNNGPNILSIDPSISNADSRSIIYLGADNCNNHINVYNAGDAMEGGGTAPYNLVQRIAHSSWCN